MSSLWLFMRICSATNSQRKAERDVQPLLYPRQERQCRPASRADIQACTTFTLLLSLPFLARRASAPLATRRWATAVAGAAIAQVTLGITTLLYMVPTHVAATHQAGSVVLLSCLLGLAGTMRRPGRAARAIKSVMAAAPRT